jgi:hypothetical protein
MITNEMYNNELMNYPLPFGNDNPDMSGFEGWGHMSQIVWKTTTSVGCAIQTCSSLVNIPANSGIPPIFLVCNYKPPGGFVPLSPDSSANLFTGNFAGEYSNVGAPLGRPMVVA